MYKMILVILFTVFVLFYGRSVVAELDGQTLQPSDAAVQTGVAGLVATSSLKTEIVVGNYDHTHRPNDSIQAIEYYSSTIANEIRKNFHEKYDISDCDVVIRGITMIQDAFQNWDTLSHEDRKKMEIAHQYAVRLLSIVFEKTDDPDVRQKIFLFIDECFNRDGNFLPSLLAELPYEKLTLSKTNDPDAARVRVASFFLTDNLWKLLDRTDDFLVINGIVVLVYKMDSATGYRKINEKWKKIEARGELTIWDKATQSAICAMNSYQRYDEQKREDPNFDIRHVSILPPRVWLCWERDEYYPASIPK